MHIVYTIQMLKIAYQMKIVTVPKGLLEQLNFTNPRCLPLSFEDAEDARRERQIHDQNRCPPGYELVDIEDKPEEEYGNVGGCVAN